MGWFEVKRTREGICGRPDRKIGCESGTGKHERLVRFLRRTRWRGQRSSRSCPASCRRERPEDCPSAGPVGRAAYLSSLYTTVDGPTSACTNRLGTGFSGDVLNLLYVLLVHLVDVYHPVHSSLVLTDETCSVIALLIERTHHRHLVVENNETE